METQTQENQQDCFHYVLCTLLQYNNHIVAYELPIEL